MSLIAPQPPSPEFRFKQLLLEARRGSSEARWLVIQLFRNTMLSIANEKVDPALNAREAPSDIVQETILEAQRDLDHFQGKTEPEMKSWLMTILIHNIKNLHQKYHAQCRDVSRERTIHAQNDENAPFLTAPDPSPSKIVARRERQHALETAIRSLPDRYQTIIDLRYDKKLSFAEIAILIDRTEAAARKRWARALLELSRLLRNLN